MSTTGRDVISAAARLIGVLASGESLEAQEATDGLNALNRMIDSWSNEALTIYTKPREVFTLTPGTASYTMGTGGTFDTARPTRIENAGLILTDANPNIERPIRIINKDEFSAIPAKSLQSTIPMWLYVDDTYPLSTLTFWAVPSTAYQVALYSSKPLTTITTLDTALSLPPGYEEAIIYNLAARLSPEYGRPLDPVVAEIAAESKGHIKRMNTKPLYMQVDSALQTRAGRYNIYTGDYTP